MKSKGERAREVMALRAARAAARDDVPADTAGDIQEALRTLQDAGRAVSQLPAGQQYTIAGIQRLRNGKIIVNCDPGKETVFVSRGPA